MVRLGPPRPLSPASVPGSPGTPSPAPGLAPPPGVRPARAPAPAPTPAPWSSLRALADFVVPRPRPPRPNTCPALLRRILSPSTHRTVCLDNLPLHSQLHPKPHEDRVFSGFAHWPLPSARIRAWGTSLLQTICRRPSDSLVTFVQLFTKMMFPVTTRLVAQLTQSIHTSWNQ